jgi:hypothetical protein
MSGLCDGSFQAPRVPASGPVSYGECPMCGHLFEPQALAYAAGRYGGGQTFKGHAVPFQLPPHRPQSELHITTSHNPQGDL